MKLLANTVARSGQARASAPAAFTALAIAVCILGWIATVIAQECPNMFASTELKSICTECTDSGPRPKNTGVRCSYVSANYIVFCDCSIRVKCVTIPNPDGTPVKAWVTVTERAGGICTNGACEGFTQINSWEQWLPVRISIGCHP